MSTASINPGNNSRQIEIQHAISETKPDTIIGHYWKILSSEPKELRIGAANALLSSELAIFLESLMSKIADQNRLQSLAVIRLKLRFDYSTLEQLRVEVGIINIRLIAILENASNLKDLAKEITPPVCLRTIFTDAFSAKATLYHKVWPLNAIKDPMRKIDGQLAIVDQLIKAKHIDTALDVSRLAVKAAEDVTNNDLLKIRLLQKIALVVKDSHKDLAATALTSAIACLNGMQNMAVSEQFRSKLTEELESIKKSP